MTDQGLRLLKYSGTWDGSTTGGRGDSMHLGQQPNSRTRCIPESRCTSFFGADGAAARNCRSWSSTHSHLGFWAPGRHRWAPISSGRPLVGGFGLKRKKEKIFKIKKHLSFCVKGFVCVKPVHPVTTLLHPMTTLSNPVMILSHPVTDLSHPLTTLSDLVTTLSHTVTTPSHLV